MEFCRECRDERDEIVPADFILWGKLFPEEALGPRCYDHTAKWIKGGMGQISQYAVYDLRQPPADQIIADARQRLRERLMGVADADDSVDVDDAYDVAMEQIRRVVKEDRAALAEQVKALPQHLIQAGDVQSRPIMFVTVRLDRVLAVVDPDAGSKP